MSDDYKFQLSKKINGDLYNLRANSGEELAQLAQGLSEHAEVFLSGLSDFTQAVLAKGILTEEPKAPAAEKRTSTRSSGGSSRRSSSRSGAAPRCKHGEMKDFADRNYRHRYYCPSSDRDDQCEPED
jgi:hypothetical protein